MFPQILVGFILFGSPIDIFNNIFLQKNSNFCYQEKVLPLYAMVK